MSKRMADYALLALSLAATVALAIACPPTADVPGGPGDDDDDDNEPVDAGSEPGPDAGVSGPDAGVGEPDAGVDEEGPVDGNLDVEWIHGAANCSQSTDPAIQVHEYKPDTFILRQSKCVNFEAPFLYLLFGADRALLEDTGATASAAAFPVAATVQGIIDDVLAARGQASIELIVMHSHAHGDHVQGDAQFAGADNVTLVGPGLNDVIEFFNLPAWPEGQAELDLGGGRVVDVIPIPGHQDAHLALYDRRDGLLLTGDSLYPGHLFINDWNVYRASIRKLVDFVGSPDVEGRVLHVLGTHIEMTSAPGVEYEYGTVFQPDEHVLQLDVAHLIELDEALTALGDVPTFEVHDDFIIFP